jgi:hypothetical protein
MIEYILKLMAEIEKEKPLEYEHESDGRYNWPERWNALKKMLERLNVS